MGTLSDVYKIDEVTKADMAVSTAYRFTEPIKQEFTLNITNMSEQVFGFNTLVLWNFGDPFAAEIDENPNEQRTEDLLGVAHHHYKYAGVYTINVILYVNNYFFYLTKAIEISDGLDTLSISPASGTYRQNTMISFSTYDAKAKIFYTDDGTDPTISTTVKAYTEPFEMLVNSNRTQTFKYFAILSSGRITDVETTSYELLMLVPEITIAPSGVAWPAGIDVTFEYANVFFDAEYTINGGNWTSYTYGVSFPIAASSAIYYRLKDKNTSNTYTEKFQHYVIG